ncbi:MAG TPA: long-chain fatty acid--CoA ligase [Solirubrobacterales bacterium]|jgi:long-subunit acyl-CoA synthetase (AMP-forming)|nr:long-chain fatty acid--CoA ligase [Solirubrobacterales bacterium]
MSDRPKAFTAETMCEAFQVTAEEWADSPALRLKDSDYKASFAEYAEAVRRRAAGLAKLGVKRGDTVGFMLINRPALHLNDCAAMHLGATCFSVYNTSSPEQVEYVVRDAGNRVIVTEQAFLETVLAAREQIEGLEHVVVIDGEAPEGTISIDELEGMGDSDFDFEATWRAVEPGDVLCLIYTSGTTGPPKGVQLTHANMVAVWRACDAVQATKPGGRFISFLPSAHIADRWAGLYAQMFYGSCVFCCPDPRQMVAYSIEVKPTVWGGVPRIWEKLKAAIEIGIAAEADEAKREATEAAIELGRRRARALMDGGAPEELQAEWDRADEQVLSKIRALLGLDQVESFVVGAAPTPPEVLEFFLALGIEIRETWGMSETTAITTLNPPGRARVGTVGPPIPNTEVKLAEDGEVMVRGPQVMLGYRNLPEKTAEALTEDGWLLTGDIGEFDEQGYLRIVDRKKELIINAAGKNMSPANIEAKLKAASTLIAQAVAVGDNRPYNVALIALDPESLAARGAAADDPAVAKEIAEAIEAANARLSRVEQIKRYKLLSGEWLPGGEELTPTMKLKRRPIERKYEADIEALYSA